MNIPPVFQRINAWCNRPLVVLAALFFPLIVMGAAQPQQCTIPDTGSIPIPLGLTAHLENPQVAVDGTCTVFAATRPNSATGGLVWKVEDGQPVVVLEIDPRKMYALGEFFEDNQGRLFYATVPDPNPNAGGDNDRIDYYRVPGWMP